VPCRRQVKGGRSVTGREVEARGAGPSAGTGVARSARQKRDVVTSWRGRGRYFTPGEFNGPLTMYPVWTRVNSRAVRFCLPLLVRAELARRGGDGLSIDTRVAG
jgi:hypothetical protein